MGSIKKQEAQMSSAPALVSEAKNYRRLDFLLIGASLEEERGPVVVQAPAAAPKPSREVRMDLGPQFRAILRLNLRAAAQHVSLGHEAPNFRQCSHACCRDADNLVPYLVPADLGITDAEMDAIFDRASAALEVLDQQELAVAA